MLQIDTYNGRLLDTIDELGIRDDTIFVFTADNGPEATDHENNSGTVETLMQGSAGPWRGTLFTGFEGGLRVPFAIRWPSKIPAGMSNRHSQVAASLDKRTRSGHSLDRLGRHKRGRIH